MSEKRIYVFAGSYEQARRWADAGELDSSQWSFLNDETGLLGLCDPIVAKVGTYWEHPRCREIRQQIVLRKRGPTK